MPHCILEASDNLLDSPDWQDLLGALHRTLVGTGLFSEADIKSRVIRHTTFRVADGAPDRAFVTLDVQILEGRPDEVKARISEALLPLLIAAFPRSAAGMKLNVTVQVSDLHRLSYRRHQSQPG
jgi:5-carboxymethyl-2-hydroxymuconate isomerase